MSTEGSEVAEGKALAPPRVVFADDWVVVVDKPSGMPSVPARTPLDPPAVAVRLAPSFGRLEAVHRLDRDTSGLLILARGTEARAALGIAFEQRRVAKRYLAVVAGRPTDSSGTIALPLARDHDNPPCHKVDHVHGRPATTSWRLVATHTPTAPGLTGRVEQSPSGALDHSVSLMDLEPLTGRSHQLRIHLATLGYPILGDRLYGDPPWNTHCPLALHAATLAFDHPTTGQRLMFTALPPACPPWLDFATETTSALAAGPND